MLKAAASARAEAEAGRLRLVLASKSPRRVELLRESVLGGEVPFEVRPSGFKEDYDKKAYQGRAREYVQEYALQKALDVRKSLIEADGVRAPTLVIGCDTVVVRDNGAILEKPASEAEAKDTIQSYSGRAVDVVSGLALVLVRPGDAAQNEPCDKELTTCQTRVFFADLDADLVAAYVATGEPMDKAGGFGIQGLGAVLVRAIEGCYFNVVGLPVQVLSNRMLDILARNRLVV